MKKNYRFQITNRRCSYCGSRAHAVQFCPKTHAGMVRIEQRAAMSRQQKEMEGNGNAAKNTEVVPSSRVWENNH